MRNKQMLSQVLVVSGQVVLFRRISVKIKRFHQFSEGSIYALLFAHSLWDCQYNILDRLEKNSINIYHRFNIISRCGSRCFCLCCLWMCLLLPRSQLSVFPLLIHVLIWCVSDTLAVPVVELEGFWWNIHSASTCVTQLVTFHYIYIN